MSRTKRFTPPTCEHTINEKTVQKYWNRSKESENLTMLQWLRQFDTNKTNPKPYKQGSTIVGTKTVSLLNNEYFFQYVLLNLPHRNFHNLCYPNHEQLPNQLQWFGAALHHFGSQWTTNDRLKSWLKTQGQQDFYIATILSYVASLCDLLYLLRIGNEQLENVRASTKSHSPLIATN